MKTPRPPWLIVAAVLAVHLLLGREVQRIHDGWVSESPPTTPARMQVEFVQEMALQTPPAARPVPPPPPAPRPVASPATTAASAPQEPASAPEPAPEPAPAPERVVEAAPAELAAPAASAAPSDEPGPEWPLSTRLSYELTGNYRGPVTGQAQVEWLRKGRDYQIHLDVGVGPSFAPLITRRISSHGRLTPGGISPQRYDEETKLIFGEPRRLNLTFLGGEQWAPGGRGAPQDAVSQFVQLTWLALTGRETLEAGRVIQLPLQLPSGPYDWQYEVVGEEVLNTPMGPLAAWHLRPRQPARGNDLAAEVWLAPSLQYLPVRLVIRQDAGTYIDLMLKSAPLQAAPESTDGIPRRLSQ
ncbi:MULTISPECIES: DUF3108 domain-containing protein [unclassified Roseateles]|uniref:DUF3108 domain-containing protein n=1 Tax=unclassified Roseateles TaxID=2626991 RepID=UPI0006F53F07|nr:MULTISPECIES: DUF3108 domain-containing protein [unclassified Roseateles]KQW42117.1 hypothetical protein ASC81_22725 [Pelomonas sp. Root405]KRA67720.1 hypothetical protein ASD88_24310 [Pelomonas sp. Root662]